MQNKRVLEYALAAVAIVAVVVISLYFSSIPTPSSGLNATVSTTSIMPVNGSNVSTSITTTILNSSVTTISNSTGNNGGSTNSSGASNSTATNNTSSNSTVIGNSGPKCPCLNASQLQAMLNDSYAEGLNSTYTLNRTQEVYKSASFSFNITVWQVNYNSGTYTDQDEGVSYGIYQNDPGAAPTYNAILSRAQQAYGSDMNFSRENGTVDGLTYTMYNSILQSSNGISRFGYFVGYKNETYVLLVFNTPNSGIYATNAIALALANVSA